MEFIEKVKNPIECSVLFGGIRSNGGSSKCMPDVKGFDCGNGTCKSFGKCFSQII